MTQITSWTKSTIGECFDTQLGKMLNNSKQIGTDSIPYLRNINVQWGSLDLTDVKSMDIAEDEREKFTAMPGDLLVCEGGAVGRCAIWHGPQSIGIQNALHRIRSTGKVELAYLRYYLEYLSFNGTIATHASGVTIKHLTQEKLRKLPIAYPDIANQQRIVATLEDHLSRLDKALEEVKSAKQKAVVFKRSYLLSVTEGSIDILGSSAIGWDSKPLGNLGKWRGGGTPSKRESAYWIGGTIPWLTAKDMKRFAIDTTEDCITEAGLNGSSANLLPANSVVIVARSGILEHTLPVALTQVPVTINQDLKALVCTPEINPRWVAYSLIAQGQAVLEQCRKAGTTVANLNFEEFLKFEIKVPATDVQLALVETIEATMHALDSVFSTISQTESHIAELRRAVLQSAFNGKLT